MQTKGNYSLKKIFPMLDDEGLQKLQDSSSVISLRRGKNLFVAGDTPRSVYAIANGCMKIVREHAEGGNMIVRIVKSGDALGINEVLTGTNYLRTAVALRDCEIFAIDLRVFTELLNKRPALSIQFLKNMCAEVSRLEHRLESSMFRTAKTRVTGVLYELHGAFVQADGNTFEPPLSRRDIAEMADVAPETVSRVLADLKVGGVLDAQGPTFRVMNINAFVGEAEGVH